MKLIHIYKKMVLAIAITALCLSSTLVSAQERKTLLADGELFTVARVMDTGKILYENTANSTWVWQGTSGYPLGLSFGVIVNKANTRTNMVEKKHNFKAKVSTESILLAQEAKASCVGKSYENKLILYGTTGESEAKTAVAINKVELFGRLLNVTIALRNVAPNISLPKALTYQEAKQTISFKKLPKFGNLRVRFVDMKGNTLKIEDVVLGR
ncbi:MAG: hypothetical protein PHR07_02015 [Acidaminococcaceae bacterium]|nr:hypothetical protein [Acidaminococcaceae bacterium]